MRYNTELQLPLQISQFKVYNMKLYSPDGTAEVDAHPSKVESMLAKGWMPEKLKAKSKAKAEAKAEDKIEEKES